MKSNLQYFDTMINDIIEKGADSEFEYKLLDNYKMIIKSCNKYRKYLSNQNDLGDLLQEGLIILIDAIDTYKPIVLGMKVKFSTYLYLRLDGYLQLEFNKKMRLISIPQKALKNSEISVRLDVDHSRIEVEVKGVDIESKIDLEVALSNLTIIEQDKINKYYLLGLTYEKIGNEYGVTKQAIQKSINKILIKLNKEMI